MKSLELIRLLLPGFVIGVVFPFVWLRRTTPRVPPNMNETPVGMAA